MSDTITTEAEVDTTTTETPEAPQDATHAPQTPDEAEVEHEADEAQHGREAARYRRKLREAETERDALRAQVDALRRAQVAAAITAAKHTAKVELLDAAGIPISELLNDDGTVDTAKVVAAIERAARMLGVATRTPYAPPAEGQGRVGRPIGGSTHGWADAFAPRR